MSIEHKMQRKINKDDFLDMKKVREGDQFFEVRVNAIGAKGDGISKLQNKQNVIIKDKTLEVGQIVDIEITIVKDRFVFAKLI